MEKNCSKSFSDASNSSDIIEEKIIKQLSTPKPFDMEPHKAIPKKHFLYRKKKITVKKKII